MRYEPKQKGKAPETMCMVLFVCAGIMVGAANIERLLGRGFMQGMAVIFLGVMIYIAVRYIFTSFRYEIVAKSKSEDAPVKSLAPEKLELRIARQMGKRGYIYENVIALDSIVSFERLEEGRLGRAKIKSAASGVMYKYIKNMARPQKWLAVVQCEDKKIRVVLEFGDDAAPFYNYLHAVVRYNDEEKSAD